MATPSCIFDPFAFQTSPQAVVFLLQMVSTAPEIRPSVWLVPLALPPYPDASEGTGLLGIDSLGCWSL